MLGSIFPLTGPASEYAPIVQTVDAYFRRANDEGGINGRTTRFLVEDDQYWPPNTSKAAKKLVEDDQVFALVGNLGTATTAAISEYINGNKVPLLFLVSGDPAWQQATKNPCVMSLPPSYAAESRILGRYIAVAWPGKKVGALYQTDEFGSAFLAYKDVLGASNTVVKEVAFHPAARDLTVQVRDLQAMGTEVLVLAATAKPAGLALKAAADAGWKPGIVMSAAGADTSLFGLAGGAANAEGVVSSVWERPVDDGSPEVRQVMDLMEKYAPQVQITQGCVTGYMIATLAVETLRHAGVNPTRASMMAAAESFHDFVLPQLLPGSTVTTSSHDHEPVKSLQLTRASNGRFLPFGGLVSDAGIPG
jgi:ABC-type branched-subunit amino acid transport system substrate-binding protein